MLEKNYNSSHIVIIVILLALIFIAIYLGIYKWTIPSAFTYLGIVCNLTGTLWIASGVYLLSKDRESLKNGKPASHKNSKNVSKLLLSASRTIPFGIAYILVGAGAQLIVAVGTQLNYF
jgi:uncharacterized membrane protein SirB2